MFQGTICVPKNPELIQKILQEAHSGYLSVHPGSTKMYNNLKQLYWWSGTKRDISEFVSKCLVCQQGYDGFCIGITPVPKKKDAIWVVVDRLTKSTHFIPVRTDYSLDKLAELYIYEIVRFCGVSISIISDRDPNLHHDFGRSCKKLLILEDMLRCCVLEFESNWEKYLSLVEFAYNNSFQSSIKMAQYEALYGRK
ncbi:DNA/RNA polymerases superfamily protein [Gossypium australe]|uniref:DNA/RNA polymerases superfamily protein n=1 Tax=Gossypium australe TaxID=47621 RepID=A0A5B6WFH1_9ROSI|nr:DNA/RNA polymerases superfamily protein [Gossypium australe]